MPASDEPQVAKTLDEITLTTDQVAEALYRYKMEIWRQQGLARQAWREKMNFPAILPTWEQLYDRAEALLRQQKHPRPFTLSHGIYDVLVLLSLYFSEDPRFENPETLLDAGLNTELLTYGPFRLDRGIYLVGGFGRTKSSLMGAFQENPRRRFRLTPTKLVASRYETQGSPGLDPFYKAENPYCFEDLGFEPNPARHFGGPLNVMEQVLYMRDTNDTPGPHTHIITNLPPVVFKPGEPGQGSKEVDLLVPSVDALYGTHIRSRMRKNFNLLIMPSTIPDMR